MSDRLKELLHQRALAQEQLTWVEREIARETGGQPTPPATPVVRATDQGAASRPNTAATTREAESIMAQYQRHSGQSVQDEVKRGCFLYAAAALGALITAIVAVWFFKYR